MRARLRSAGAVGSVGLRPSPKNGHRAPHAGRRPVMHGSGSGGGGYGWRYVVNVAEPEGCPNTAARVPVAASRGSGGRPFYARAQQRG
jgi:hypothetical protein